MKTGLLTLHYIPNYGAILQTYATVEIFRELGGGTASIEVIDYRQLSRECLYSSKGFQQYLKTSDSLIEKLRRTKGYLISNHYKEVRQTFHSFVESELPLSRRWNRDNLLDTNNVYSSIIVGSDQVWNPYLIEEDYTYLLDYYSGRKYSYASSIGIDSIPTEFREVYKKYLSSFIKVSCREQSGAEDLSKIISKSVQCVLDPTLLLNREKWEQIAAKGNVNLSDHYIFLYIVKESIDLLDFAEKAAESLGKRLVIVSTPSIYEKVKRVRSNLCSCTFSPYDWVDLIRNADFVITNSFHGVAFSIMFEKHVYIERNNGHTLAKARINNIVNLLGLENACLDMHPIAGKKYIEFDLARKKLSELRNISLGYFQDIVDDIESHQ